MLLLKPNCQACDRDLPPHSRQALICSFECTFCADCARALRGICPNCGSELKPRPARPSRSLASRPAGAERLLRGRGD